MTKNNRPVATMMMPLENRREAILELATTADKTGYNSIYLTESWSYDSTLLLTEIAMRTEKIKLGTAVLSIWGRSAGTFSMSAATLNKISGGRFTLGLGSSTKQLTEGFHDVPYGLPYQKIRKILQQTRSLLEGGRIPLDPNSDVRPLKLNLKDIGKIPIMLAASSDRSIELAWELCEGWIPFLYPKSNIRKQVNKFHLSEVLTERQKNWQIAPIIPAIANKDRALARKGASWVVAFYINKMGPVYRDTLKRIGFADEIDCVLAASKLEGKPVVPQDAEALLSELALYGTPDEIKENLEDWYEAGATEPCLMTNPNLNMDEIKYNVESLAP
ncbi:MAG: LLM class flavin-dependent oxidoreductase [Chloroflexi bacterium]|jgi:alkanesulfonate monooxygenase SsuD/methylene tetrahydromethanopterin reductase-like flavin-dependent oxidoreductase (luciferase family)|nr:LLM class flavin-dependent oxidoreductase [Chloroflexota bacterium]MBT3670576.1 LLM class flavin-dependent oxidoreductase [Chloroflexota bacterium]MBT4002402.1 LLM class flavin-dependent oxidoreductase [Chloroflexota bacterium]MBT4304211.1 LLM class flavin-dependent oxidoreductase [Chloroflexota bacterium]MBT4533430.1 LLM class flavin-dependent oxidoreductase [Chloroflexota bacterium]